MTRHDTAEHAPRRTRGLGRALMLLAVALAVAPDVVRADTATDEAAPAKHERHHRKRDAKKAADSEPAATAVPDAAPAAPAQQATPTIQVQPTLTPQGATPGMVPPATPGAPAVPAGPAGKLEIKETTFDAGTVERGVKLSHAFELKNVGDHDLTVDAKPG